MCDALQDHELEDADEEPQADHQDADFVPIPTEASKKEVPRAERLTTRYLTKYERARLLGTRALQIR